MSGIARLHFVVITLLVLLAAYVYGTWPQSAESKFLVADSPYCKSETLAVAIMAKAAYVEDLKTGAVIYQKQADAQLGLASITKLMTVLVAHDLLKPDDTITITAQALVPEGQGLNVGEVWRAEDLMDYTLIASVNDGAEALALSAAATQGEDMDGFVARMNAKASAIGLTQTYFANATGLDISETSGGSYGSARDAAKLLSHAISNYPRLMERSASGRAVFVAQTGEEHVAKNTSGFIGSLPGAIASKTGFTDLAGGNLTIVFEPMPGRPVSAAVLGSTREGRDTDMKALAKATKKWMTRTLLCESSGAENTASTYAE